MKLFKNFDRESLAKNPKFMYPPREIQKNHQRQDSGDNDSITGIDDSIEGLLLS